MFQPWKREISRIVNFDEIYGVAIGTFQQSLMVMICQQNNDASLITANNFDQLDTLDSDNKCGMQRIFEAPVKTLGHSKQFLSSSCRMFVWWMPRKSF